jgi:ribonuclease III family protein
MDKSLELASLIRNNFGEKEVEINTYSPLALAYIGDGIYDLIIRTMVVERGNTAPAKLHQRTSKLVCAAAQSEMIKVLQPLLTEEELDVFRRGRNAKSVTMAKHASMSDYRRATGFEALMGYLYLNDQIDRILELVTIGLKETQEGFLV